MRRRSFMLGATATTLASPAIGAMRRPMTPPSSVGSTSHFRICRRRLSKFQTATVIMPARLAATDPFKQIPEAIGSGPFDFLADVQGATAYHRSPFHDVSSTVVADALSRVGMKVEGQAMDWARRCNVAAARHRSTRAAGRCSHR